MNLIMREKHLSTILAIEAAICVLFCILQHSASSLFSTMIAFPFEQLGIVLRALSLSGTIGNIVAVILYVLISLIPVTVLLLLKKKQKSEKIDNILFLLSASLFLVLFYMINPGLFEAGIPETGKWALGSTFYSLLLGYLLIRSLLHYKNAGIKQLQKGIYLLLGVLNVVFVYAIFGQELGQWLQNIETVQNGNSGITINDGFITFHFDCDLYFPVPSFSHRNFTLYSEYCNNFPFQTTDCWFERKSISGGNNIADPKAGRCMYGKRNCSYCGRYFL